MLESINCSSCGASNQFPEGKTSMFCAFCGNSIAVETKIPKLPTSGITKSTFVEGREGKKLSYIKRNIKSIDEIVNLYSDSEIEEIKELDLSNNNITSLEGIERFELNYFNISGNNLTEIDGLPQFARIRINTDFFLNVHLDFSNNLNLIRITDNAIIKIQNPETTNIDELIINLDGCINFNVNQFEIIDFSKYKRNENPVLFIVLDSSIDFPESLIKLGFRQSEDSYLSMMFKNVWEYHNLSVLQSVNPNNAIKKKSDISKNKTTNFFSNFTTLNWVHILSPLFIFFILALLGTKLDLPPISYWGYYGFSSFMVIILSSIRFMNYDTKTGRSFQTKYGRIDEYKTVHGNANVTSYFWFITLFHIITVIICFKLANDFDDNINLNNYEVSNTQSTINSTSPSSNNNQNTSNFSEQDRAVAMEANKLVSQEAKEDEIDDDYTYKNNPDGSSNNSGANSNNNQNTSNFTEQDRAVAMEASKPLNQEAEEGELDDDYAYNHIPDGSSINSGSNSNNNGIEIGSKYGAGIVAYIYQPGDARYIEGEIHGFIMAPRDAFSPSWNEAANVCDTLNIDGEIHWQLPNRDQIQVIGENIKLLGGYIYGHNAVWSSTEYNANYAASCYLNMKGYIAYENKNTGLYVRAIKYF